MDPQNDLSVSVLNFAKQKYPALGGIENESLVAFFLEIGGNPDKKGILLESKHAVVPPISYTAALDQAQLPKGWGDFLLSLTNPLVEEISGGMSSTLIATYASNPYLMVLLKLVLIYAIFTKSGNKGPEDSIITRGDYAVLAKDDAHLGALASNAQELLDLFHVMPKLRNGGTRLFPRMVSCIERILTVEW